MKHVFWTSLEFQELYVVFVVVGVVSVQDFFSVDSLEFYFKCFVENAVDWFEA